MVRLALLEPRVSVLEDDFDEDALEQEAGKAAAAAVRIPSLPCLRRARAPACQAHASSQVVQAGTAARVEQMWMWV